MIDPWPSMVIWLVMTGRPFPPKVLLCTVSRLKVDPSSVIVSASLLALAALIALMRQVTLPPLQEKGAACAADDQFPLNRVATKARPSRWTGEGRRRGMSAPSTCESSMLDGVGPRR